MTQINWGLAQGNGFQNALAQGYQLGSNIRQRREETEYKNALANYDPANPDSLKDVMRVDPRLGIQLRRDTAAQEQAARKADISRRAASGDQTAMAELAGLDLGAWRGLSADQKKAADEQTTVFANAALDVLNYPPEQRNAALNAYIDRFNNPELEQYRGLQGQQLEQALRSVVAQSNMITKLHEAEQPRYQVVPEGGVLVDTRNPEAVGQFRQGGNVPRVSDEASYNALPPGSQYYDPNGNLRTKGGTAGNGGGGF